MILVAGSGGVGKTTIAAALGVAAAERHRGRILVMTVDPARRLATALGLDEFGNTPVQIDPAAFAASGVTLRGRGVGGDARHQGGLGRADHPSGSRCRDPRRRAREPAVREHHPPFRRTATTTPRDRAAARPARQRGVRSRDRRHAAVARMRCRSSTLRTGWSSSSGAGCCGGSPCRTGHASSRSPRKPFYQVADRVLGSVIPPGHRRLLRALPGDGERVRPPRQGGRSAARRPSHRLRRRSRRSRPPRVTRPGSSPDRYSTVECRSGRSSPTGCCRNRWRAPRRPTAPRRSSTLASGDVAATRSPRRSTLRRSRSGTVLKRDRVPIDDVAAWPSPSRIGEPNSPISHRCCTRPGLSGDIHDLARAGGYSATTCATADHQADSVMTSLDDSPRRTPRSIATTSITCTGSTAEWAFLADLCFADLLLYVRSSGGQVVGRRSGAPADRTRRCTPPTGSAPGSRRGGR